MFLIMYPKPEKKSFINKIVGAIVVCVLIALAPGPAQALLGDSDGVLGLDASLRNISGIKENYKFAPFFGSDDRTSDAFSQTLLRITAKGRPNRLLSYEAHVVQDFSYLSSPTAQSTDSGQISRYRAMDEALDYWSDSYNSASLWVDRANFKMAFAWGDITIGRQAISFGKAYFWNPLDVYLPFDPRQFDRDYKPGVDAVRVDMEIGNFSGATLVGVAGTDVYEYDTDDNNSLDASWYGSSVLARLFTNFRQWDFVAQGGKVYGGWQVGAGLVGEIKTIEIRAEGAYFQAKDSPALPCLYVSEESIAGLTPAPPQKPKGCLFEDGFTIASGIGRRFENSVTIEIEYLYNQNGADRDPDELTKAWTRWANNSIIQIGRHLAGATAAYEYSPLTAAKIGALYSFSDDSLQIQPSMTTSISDNMELIIGGILNFGRRPTSSVSINPFAGTYEMVTKINSEFGTQSHTFFIEGKLYF